MKNQIPILLSTFTLTTQILPAITTVYTVQDAGTFPNGSAWNGAVFESGDVNARNAEGDLTFHGYGGGAADSAFGFTTNNVTPSGSASLIDGNLSYSLGVGDTLQIQSLVGGFNVGAGTTSNSLNQILQIGLTTANSGSAFTMDSLFLSGFESSFTTGSSVDVGLGFRNESGAIGGSIGTATQTHSFAGVSNNTWLLGLSFTRNFDDSISWGLALDEVNAQAGPNLGNTIERFTGSGELAAGDHGLSSFDNLNVALGYDIVDRSQIAVSGTSYDWDSALPDARFVLVPEPTAVAFAFLSLFGLSLRRKR